MWQLERSIYKNVTMNVIVQYHMYTLVIIMIVLVRTLQMCYPERCLHERGGMRQNTAKADGSRLRHMWTSALPAHFESCWDWTDELFFQSGNVASWMQSVCIAGMSVFGLVLDHEGYVLGL